MSSSNPIESLKKYARSDERDVYLYWGGINYSSSFRPCDSLLSPNNRAEKATLILSTFGGSPDAAFRIARAFQEAYPDDQALSVLIPCQCKSAGTLMACGFHELVIGPRGELGPLDIQVDQKDELIESISGLNHQQSLLELQTRAFEMFEDYFIGMLSKSGGRLKTRSAMDVASGLVQGLLEPLYSRIDPIRVGEVTRANMIGKTYAERLDAHAKNLKPGSVDNLVVAYPSHGFVIDFKESDGLFERVRRPSQEEAEIALTLNKIFGIPRDDREPVWLEILVKETGESDEDEEQTGSESIAAHPTAPELIDDHIISPDEGSGAQPAAGPQDHSGLNPDMVTPKVSMPDTNPLEQTGAE